MQVAICGLGRMGAGMARRAARGGHDVVAWNRTEAVATEIAGGAGERGPHRRRGADRAPGRDDDRPASRGHQRPVR